MLLAFKLPPRLVIAKIAKRIPWINQFEVRVAEIMHSPKELQPDRLIGFFRSQQDFLQKIDGWDPLDFKGCNVIEIGPGSLGGLCPMSVFLGAKSVYGVEPNWMQGILDDPRIISAFLIPHHAALVREFGPLMDFMTFQKKLCEGLKVEAVDLENADPNFEVDIVISNSCLEHVCKFDSSIKVLSLSLIHI